MAAVSRPGPRSKKPSGAPPRTGTRTSILSSGAVDGGTAPRAAPGSPSFQMPQQLSGCTTKRRLAAEWRTSAGYPSEDIALHGRYVDLVILGQTDPDNIETALV